MLWYQHKWRMFVKIEKMSNEKQQGNNRDHYIDAMKGVAILGVLFIHTVFGSGDRYVPGLFRTIALLIDVPIFFFLSGMTSSGNIGKVLKRLVNLQITYMGFMTLVFLMVFLYMLTIHSQTSKWSLLFHWYCHNYLPSDPFFAVKGSMWYMRVYFGVSVVAVVLMKYFSNRAIDLSIVFLISVVSLGVGLAWQGIYEVLWQVIFYLPICLAGYRLKNVRLKMTSGIFVKYILPLSLFAGILCVFAGVSWMQGRLFVLQEQKFPPSIIYLLASIPSLFMIFVWKGRIQVSQNNVLAKMGQNAIFYYFAQGISSSLLDPMVSYGKTHVEWYWLLPIMFCLNVAMAIPIAYMLKRMDSLMWSLFCRRKQ